MTLEEFINSQEIALYIQNLPPQTTIDKVLFPSTKQLGTEIELAKGSQQKPIALKISTFDTAVKSRALNATIDVNKKEMPFFKESIPIKEKDRQNLLLAMQANNENLVEQLTSQVYNNYQNLVDGAEVQMRRMRVQALQKAEINITSKDGDIVADYEAPANHKEVLIGTAMWSNPSADIVGDLIRWSKALTDDGYGAPTRILISSVALGYIQGNTAIRNELMARNIGAVIITTNDIINYLNTKVGLSVGILNYKPFIAEDGTSQQYYDANIITLIPDGSLGSTVYGTTPEEADKIYGTGKLDTAIVNTGVAITTKVQDDPVFVETKVSQLGIPSFDRVDECFFATVA